MNPRVKVKVLRTGRYEISPHLSQYVLSDDGIALSDGEIMIDIPLDHAELMAKTDWLEIVREPVPVPEPPKVVLEEEKPAPKIKNYKRTRK